MVIPVPEYVRRVLSALEGASWESYAVGGCVRDALLRREPHDWDVTTAARPEAVKAVFAGERVIDTGLKHGTVTLLTEGGPVEITTFRTEGAYSDSRHPDRVSFVSDVHEDLCRRDFTVNAMAYSPDRGLRDDFGGQEDLRAGVIRCVGDPDERFREDALRILRALRFAARYGFVIEEATAAAMERNRELLLRLSPERVFSELKGILIAPGAGAMLRDYPEIFFTVLPELRPMRGFDQRRPHAHLWDVWDHTAYAVDAAEPEPVLRLTMLLHDAGKPETFSIDPETGLGRFYGHPAASARIAETVLRRLRCDNATLKSVVSLAERHGMLDGHGKKAMRRILSRLGEEDTRRLLAVCRADAAAHTPETCAVRLERLAMDEEALDELLREGSCLSVRDLAVGGRELTAQGFRPGPALGKTLQRLTEEVMDEKLPNEREALLRRAAEIKEELQMNEAVNVKWLGHSCFRMEYKGWSLIIDTFADGSVDGIGNVRETANALYATHGHHDHCAPETVTVVPAEAPADFTAETFETPHDHHGGAKRGMNLIHLFSFGGLRVAHMGDTGSVPAAEILEKLKDVDLMLIPVGGFFTVGADEAYDIVEKTGPKAVVPMHYRSDKFGFGVLSTLEPFAARFPAADVRGGSELTLTADGPRGLVVLQPALLK